AGSASNGGGRGDQVAVAGKGAAGLIAAYAAVIDERIAGVMVIAPQVTHMERGAPQFLNVLRVCDVPVALGLIAPRPLLVKDADAEGFASTKAAFAAAGAQDRLTLR